eukprot:g42259.t1
MEGEYMEQEAYVKQVRRREKGQAIKRDSSRLPNHQPTQILKLRRTAYAIMFKAPPMLQVIVLARALSSRFVEYLSFNLAPCYLMANKGCCPGRQVAPEVSLTPDPLP